MKRGKPLKRRRRLKADPETVREFMQRGRQELERAELKSRPKRRPREGPLTPAQWRQAAFEASEGRCIISGARAFNADDRRFHSHHILAKRDLRARKLHGWVWDPRNALWLRRDVHAQHELAVRRVPAMFLPASVWDFCDELDALEGSRWATELVLRAHPPAGHSRISH